MKPISCTVAALLFAATMTGSAEAKGPKGSSGQSQTHTPKIVVQNSTQNFTQKTITHSQKNHKGSWWNRCCWFPSYGCCGYYCPSDGCWYYYCARMGCYMPVSYMGMYPPTPDQADGGDDGSADDDSSDADDLPQGAVNMPTGARHRRRGR